MLNVQQQKAVDTNHSSVLCLAGAGTGKTHTMLARISRLVNDGVNPYSILVLTFTNAAAFEMEARYRSNHKGRISPTFSTFHAFCYSLISGDKELRSLIGYTDAPQIPTDADLKYIDTQVKQQCGTKLSREKLEGKKVLTPKERFDFDVYWKKFRQILKKENFITFDIMCYDVCKLFSENNAVSDKYKERFKYLFVDEFQDTDPKQWSFISSFTEANKFVVGDVFQAIYGFRGADSSIIKSLAESDEWETIRLIANYRSTKQICAYANTINIDAYDAYRLDLEADRDGEGVVTLDTPKMNRSNPRLQSLITDIVKHTFGTVAILSRTNADADTVKSVLDSMEIAYNTNNDKQHSVGILRSVIDNEYMVGWLSTKLSSQRYIEYVKLCAIDPTYRSFAKFYELYYTQYGVHEVINKVTVIRQILRDSKLLPYQKCVEIIKELALPQVVVDITSDKPHDIIDYMIEVATKSGESNIYVGTIHSVKGLEYDTVHVLGVNGESFPISSEEHRNLYYVAVTRAKHKLFVYKAM